VQQNEDIENQMHYFEQLSLLVAQSQQRTVEMQSKMAKKKNIVRHMHHTLHALRLASKNSSIKQKQPKNDLHSAN